MPSIKSRAPENVPREKGIRIRKLCQEQKG